MVNRFPRNRLPGDHRATFANKQMETVEGPNETTYQGVDAQYYLVFQDETETKGYVYYHTDSQELIGIQGPSGITVLNGNSKRVSPNQL